MARLIRRHTWVFWYRWAISAVVFVLLVLATVAQSPHDSAYALHMTQVAAVAVIAWLPLCFPRFTVKLMAATLAIALGAAAFGAARSGSRR